MTDTASRPGQFRGIVSYDFDYGSHYADLSLRHRFNDYFWAEAGATLFLDVGRGDYALYPVRNEDFVELKLHYSF